LWEVLQIHARWGPTHLFGKTPFRSSCHVSTRCRSVNLVSHHSNTTYFLDGMTNRDINWMCLTREGDSNLNSCSVQQLPWL
jgi:hypothetical protein